ncbi:MAG: HEPN domain-containing protein [Desulfococcaceae bacterium]|jgi:HEPN domain-containing protein|nr:HEPN domain-containing protein [Desulfococcaceae bacterium]
MNMEEHINYWLESADHDLETAETLFASGKYDWCLFIAHLVLEKGLKAVYVRDNDNLLPPRIHNLVKLAENTTLVLSDEQKTLFNDVNSFNLEVRYPDVRQEFYRKCTKDFADGYFTKIRKQYQWIKSQLKSAGS